MITIGIFMYSNVTGSPTTPAFLYIESGIVEVNSGNGWQPAVHEMELNVKDKVRTLEGVATLVFFEGEMMKLYPNTKISIEELLFEKIKLKQEKGKTWNKITKLTGTRDYEVETPNTVATVRGTAFYIKVGDEKDEIIVAEGVVKVKRITAKEDKIPKTVEGSENSKDSEIIEELSIEVKQNEKVEVGTKGTIEKVPLTEKDDEDIKDSISEDIDTLKEIRVREINKHEFLIEQAKRKYGFSDNDINDYLNQVDNGEADLDEAISQVPIKTESISKIKKITEEIANLNLILNKPK